MKIDYTRKELKELTQNQLINLILKLQIELTPKGKGRPSKLTEYDKMNIIQEHKMGYTIREIAERRNISIGLVHKTLKSK